MSDPPTGICKITSVHNNRTVQIKSGTDDTPIVTGTDTGKDECKWEFKLVNPRYHIYSITNMKYDVFAYVEPNTRPPPGHEMVVNQSPGFFGFDSMGCPDGEFRIYPGECPDLCWGVDSRDEKIPIKLQRMYGGSDAEQRYRIELA